MRSTASCATLTAGSLRSTRRAPRLPRPQPSIPRERSRGPTTTRRTWIHGFIRTAGGTFTSFDAPSGNILNSIYTGFGTPPSINPAGVIAGTYSDSSFTEHGFLREGNGTLTTIDVPGSTFTEVLAINPAGTITGDFGCTTTVCFHGFLRTLDGTFVTTGFPNFPGSGIPLCINPAGTTAGSYLDASNAWHGFVRAANGTLTTFDVPGVKNVLNFEVLAINPAGTLTGNYFTDTLHGFLRAPDGAFTTFDVPGSTGTGGNAINPAGTVAGVFLDTAGVFHGFLFFTD